MSSPSILAVLRDVSRWAFAFVCLVLGAFTLRVFLWQIPNLAALRHGIFDLYAFLLFAVVSFVALFFLVIGGRPGSDDSVFRAGKVLLNLCLAYLFALWSGANCGQLFGESGHFAELSPLLEDRPNFYRFVSYCVLGGVILLISLRLIYVEWRNTNPDRNYHRILYPLLLLHFFGFLLGAVVIELLALPVAGVEGFESTGGSLEAADVWLPVGNLIGGITSGLLMVLSLRAIKDNMAGIRPLLRLPSFRAA